MIVIDKASGEREAAGKPVRFAMVGAGFMAQGVANQVFNSTRGMELVAIANRHPDKARGVYEYAGVEGAVAVDGVRRPGPGDEPRDACLHGGPLHPLRGGGGRLHPRSHRIHRIRRRRRPASHRTW